MTGISTLGQSINQINRLKNMQSQLATLGQQLASHKKTNVFKGLGSDILPSQRARAQMQNLGTYSDNITIAQRRLKMLSTSLANIRTQTHNVVSAMQIQTQEGEIEMEALSDLAIKVRTFVSDLLNEKDGNRYLFSGADTTTAPLNKNGSLDSYIQVQMDEWVNGNITTDQLISSYRDRGLLNDTVVGYSATLSSGNSQNVTIRVDDNAEVEYTTLGNQDALRDIIVALSMVENLSKSLDEVSLDPDSPPGSVSAPGATKEEQNKNFSKLFSDLTGMLSKGLQKLEMTEYKISQNVAMVTQVKDAHTAQKAVLENTVSDIENVDLNEVAMQISYLSTQLEAAYSVTSMISNLNLANYLR